MRYAQSTALNEVSAAETQTSDAIPCELMQRMSVIACYSGEAIGQLRIEVSHDGQRWVPWQSAEVAVEGPCDEVVIAADLAFRFMRVVSATEVDPDGGSPEVPAANEIQAWTGATGAGGGGGSFTVSDGETTSDPIDVDENTQSAMLAALEDLYGAGNVQITSFAPPTWEFIGALAEQPVALVIIDTTNITPEPAQNAQWSLEVSNADGGTIDVSENGASAEGIAYNADASTVESALNGNIGDGTWFSCSGGPLNTAPVVVELVGSMAGAAGDGLSLNVSGENLTGVDAGVLLDKTQDGHDEGNPTGEVTQVQAGTPGSPAVPADAGTVTATVFLQGGR